MCFIDRMHERATIGDKHRVCANLVQAAKLYAGLCCWPKVVRRCCVNKYNSLNICQIKKNR
jgi:hypothetical protein